MCRAVFLVPEVREELDYPGSMPTTPSGELPGPPPNRPTHAAKKLCHTVRPRGDVRFACGKHTGLGVRDVAANIRNYSSHINKILAENQDSRRHLGSSL